MQISYNRDSNQKEIEINNEYKLCIISPKNLCMKVVCTYDINLIHIEKKTG